MNAAKACLAEETNNIINYTVGMFAAFFKEFPKSMIMACR